MGKLVTPKKKRRLAQCGQRRDERVYFGVVAYNMRAWDSDGEGKHDNLSNKLL
jgi:hypothetical protein